MENLQQNSFAFFLWMIIVFITMRHIFVNWKIFTYGYRTVSLISACIMLPLLLYSVWSDSARVTFFVFSLVLSYVKIYKSRVERSSLKKQIDDRFLIFSFPQLDDIHKYRKKVYFWHFVNDCAAFVFVVVLGWIVTHIPVLLSLVRIVL